MSDSHQLDPRRHAYRGDLAAAALQGRVEAPKFVEGVEAQVCVLAVPVRRRPEAMAPLDTEALFGEILKVYDDKDGWAWIQLKRDGYVGYVPSDQLRPGVYSPTHLVCKTLTVVYAESNALAEPVARLSFNAEVSVTEIGRRLRKVGDRWFHLSIAFEGGWLH